MIINAKIYFLYLFDENYPAKSPRTEYGKV